MKKGFNNWLCIILIVFFTLTGCVGHINATQISKVLDQNELYESFNVKPMDLSLHSQCKALPSVKIVNKEIRTEDYVAFNDGLRKRFINPREMMNGVCLYLENGFEKSRIKMDDQSTKVLQLKMVELQGSSDWRFKSFFKMELIIPEKNFSKFYDAWEYTGFDGTKTFFKASAYAIHDVTRQIIEDPVIQDYILCR